MSIRQAFEKFPKIETQHLILREIKLSDSADLFHILSDKKTVEFYDDDVYTEISQAQEQIKSWKNGYQNKICIRWGIVKKETGKLIGSCGFYGMHYWYRRVSIGYELNRNQWRQGIMTEALGAILEYGFAGMGLNRMDAVIMPENIASVRLLEKFGFVCEGLLAQYEKWGSKGYVDLYMYAILKKWWEAPR